MQAPVAMPRKIIKNPFIRSVLLVASGTAGAQAITLAFSPVITRLYGPEAFGLLGTFTAILSMVIPIAALTYPIAIVLPKEDNNARGLTRLSLYLALMISLLVGGVFLVGDQALAKLLRVEAISAYLLLIPVAMFLDSLRQIMEQWLIRKKQFKISARVAVSQSLIVNLSKTGVGFVHPSGAALIVLTTLGHALFAAQLWLAERRWAAPDERISAPVKDKQSLRALAHRHRDFPLYRAPQITVNAISQAAPVLLLASFFGATVAGFYTLSRTAISAPAHLLGNSVGNVFFAQIAEAVNEGRNPIPYLHRATAGAFAVALLPFLTIIIWGGPIFAFVFGVQWYEAGVYAQWVAVWLLFSLAARPVIATIPVVNMQGYFLAMETAFTVLKIGGLLIGALLFDSPLVAVALYCLASTILYISLYGSIWFRLRKNDAFTII